MAKNILMVLLGGVILLAELVTSEASIIQVPDNYKTIREAVENAHPGDTILVGGGNYNENIVITKTLTIKSDKGPDATIIKASNIAESVFRVMNADEVKIGGFTATGSTLSGIYFYNSNKGEIRDNKTIKNGIGVSLYSSSNNTITNNIANLNEQTGIYLELSHNNAIENNSADRNKEKGVFFNSSNYNKLIKNSVSLNVWNGITLWSSNNNIVERNKILRNTYGIVQSNSNDNALSDNSTWTNFYIILPIILIYVGVLIYWIQRRIFRIIYTEKNV